jgi:transcription antitermination factor NusG
MLMTTDVTKHFNDIVGQKTAPPSDLERIPGCWYILRLHPNYDLKAERQLSANGVSVYLPKEVRKVKTTWNRIIPKAKPIFPGTIFVPDFEADIARLKCMANGIGGFIKREGQALQISLMWMEKIRRFEAKMQSLSGKRKYKVGDTVRITAGPFNLWEGKIERLDPNARISVLLDMFQREVPVQLSEDEIEAV